MATEWIENYRATATYTLKNLFGCEYWKKIFKSCILDEDLDEEFCVPSNQAFLLYGEVGNGKATLAKAVAGELQQEGYPFVHLSGFDLLGNSDKETCQNIKEFFHELVENRWKAGIFVFLEEIAPLCASASVLWKLEKNIQRMSNQSQLPCVLIMTTSKIELVPMSLQKELISCYVGVPTLSERQTYLKAYLEDSIQLSSNLTWSKMAKETDTFNYGTLKKFIILLGMYYKQLILEARRDGKDEKEVALTEEIFYIILAQLKEPEKQREEKIREQKIIPVFITNKAMPMAAPVLTQQTEKVEQTEKKETVKSTTTRPTRKTHSLDD